jgi:MULE transposase domain/Amyotrophic lateral sclerosis 2 chromosomal region candidate gene 8
VACFQILKQVKAAVQSTSPPKCVLRYYVSATGEASHNHSRDAAKMTQEIHPDLIQEINRLVEAGVSSVRDMCLLLEQFVKHKFQNGVEPDRLNSGFFPSPKTVYNHLSKACYRLKKSIIDQEALSIQVEKWKQESSSNFIFRPYNDDESPTDDIQTNSVMFCHQSAWQRDLLARYGRLCLLDATYKTTKYALPLFFLTVKTNDGYIVVGTFVVQTESAELISEALRIFAEWNPDWNPQYWMTDFSEAEINAIE